MSAAKRGASGSDDESMLSAGEYRELMGDAVKYGFLHAGTVLYQGDESCCAHYLCEYRHRLTKASLRCRTCGYYGHKPCMRRASADDNLHGSNEDFKGYCLRCLTAARIKIPDEDEHLGPLANIFMEDRGSERHIPIQLMGQDAYGKFMKEQLHGQEGMDRGTDEDYVDNGKDDEDVVMESVGNETPSDPETSGDEFKPDEESDPEDDDEYLKQEGYDKEDDEGVIESK